MAGNRAAIPRTRIAPKNPRKRLIKRILWSFTAILLASFIAFGIYVWTIFNSLEPKVALLPKKRAELGLKPTVILSADGVLLCRMTNEHREPVTFPEIPKVVIDTTIAAEDKRFWEHRGVDFTAMMRAVWTNLRSGSVRQGGSTITQQIAKRLLTTGERSFRRKIEDACLAVQIERQYTKEQVLELYLNQVYYGTQAYGIKAAAAVYFGKPLDKLTLSEAAMLARLPRRPSDQNPYTNPKAAKDNRDVVLGIMLEENMISRPQYDEAIRSKIKLISARPQQQIGIRHAPYYVTWVLEKLREMYPNEDYARGGYIIHTSLNFEAQKDAEKAVADTIRRYRRRRVTEAAMVMMAMDGQVKAMVGGGDFARSQYNVITQGSRQPGSAFKPFVYATAIDMGVVRANGQVSNRPFILRDPRTGRIIWQPKGGGKGGTVSVRTALSKSINVPAVWVCDEVGPSNVVRFAHDVFGFKSFLYPGPALALGSSDVKPLEMAQGYSVFATGGHRVEPFGIRRVIGPDGTAIYENKGRVFMNVLSSSTVEPMRGHLRAVVTSGTGHNAQSVLNASGKTGTTNDHKDAWFCGYTDSLIGIAWVANATYDPTKSPPYHYGSMGGVFGGEVSAAMWAQAAKPIQKILGETTRSKTSFGNEDPEEVIGVRVCTETGLRARKECPDTEMRQMKRRESEENGRCNLHKPETTPVEEPAATPPDETPPDENPPPDEGPPPPRREDPPPPAPRTASNLRVEICVETGLRATTYCRVKRMQSFKKGTEPTDYCHVHRP